MMLCGRLESLKSAQVRIGKNAAQAQSETPAFWGWQYCEMTTKNSRNGELEAARTEKTSCVCSRT